MRQVEKALFGGKIAAWWKWTQTGPKPPPSSQAHSRRMGRSTQLPQKDQSVPMASDATVLNRPEYLKASNIRQHRYRLDHQLDSTPSIPACLLWTSRTISCKNQILRQPSFTGSPRNSCWSLTMDGIEMVSDFAANYPIDLPARSSSWVGPTKLSVCSVYIRLMQRS